MSDAILLEQQRMINDLEQRLARVEAAEYNDRHIKWLAAPLTSTSWDGDAHSTSAKAAIDLSSVFSAPANIKAVFVKAIIRDSGSAGAECVLRLAPNNTAGSGQELRCSGIGNDYYTTGNFWVPCDANGDIYYQVAASGSNTMDITLEIWGYML